jgi:hypothetical protein
MFVATGVGCTCSPRKSPYRLPRDAAAPGRTVTLATLLPVTWSEVPPADSALEPCKMDALCFDSDARPFCRNPFCFISIQNPRGVYPLLLILLIFNKLQNAPALPSSVRDLPVRQSGQFSTGGSWETGCGLYLQPAQIRVRNRRQTGTEGIRRSTTRASALRQELNFSKMTTYAKRAANPCGMHTYKIIGLKASWNEHLQKMGGGEHILLPSGYPGAKSPARGASAVSIVNPAEAAQ